MQSQPMRPFAGKVDDQLQEEPPYNATVNDDRPHGKKTSVIGKVKDTAKRLKTKIKKPKSGEAASARDENDSASSSEQEAEEGSVPEEADEKPASHDEAPVLRGAPYEAIPDPVGMQLQDKFGKLGLDEASQLQEGTPAAEGQESAGVTPFLASHDFQHAPATKPEETPTLEQPPITKPDEQQQALRIEDGPACLGRDVLLMPQGAEGGDEKQGDSREAAEAKSPTSERRTSILGQAGQKIFGSWGSGRGKPEPEEGGTNEKTSACPERRAQSFPGRAADRVLAFKDAIASKLSHGDTKPAAASEGAANLSEQKTMRESGVPEETRADEGEQQSYLEKVQEMAAGAKNVLASKLGYTEAAPESGGVTRRAGEMCASPVEEKPEEKGKTHNSYVENVQDATVEPKGALGSKLVEAKEAVGSKLVEAKDALASKLGYKENREEPADSGTNLPLSRFHPGEEDRALSEIITEKMSTSAATVKDTLLRPFSKSTPSTPTPAPPSSAMTGPDTALQSPEARDNAEQEKQQPGIVGRVTGAVTSLRGKKDAKGEGAEGEATAARPGPDSSAAAQ